MTNNCSKKFWHGRTLDRIVRGGLLALVAVAASGIASAQDADQDKKGEMTFSLPPNATTPGAFPLPPGTSEFLATHATGTQGYVCLPSGSGVSFTVNNARPEATLFSNIFGEAFQIITHFLSPDTNPNEFAPTPPPFANATWQSSFDSSKVWGQPLQAIPAGSDASCPNAGSISCLLLQAIGSHRGPTGGKILTKTTYILRLNTDGGSAPASGCSVPTDVGKQTLVSYSADYYFLRSNQ